MSNHYTYRAEWSPEDDEYVGLVAEFPSLSWLAPTAAEAISGVERLVADILIDMAKIGETPPEPFSERRYSGKLSVRTSPAQHRQLTIEAAEQGVSVNNWIIQKLGVSRAQAATPRPARPAAVEVVERSALDGSAVAEILGAYNVQVRDGISAFCTRSSQAAEAAAEAFKHNGVIHLLRAGEHLVEGGERRSQVIGSLIVPVAAEIDDDIPVGDKR